LVDTSKIGIVVIQATVNKGKLLGDLRVHRCQHTSSRRPWHRTPR
jgi:hypothetical protein